MKATVVKERICDSALDMVHSSFRYIKRLVIKAHISSVNIVRSLWAVNEIREIYIAVTPDGDQLYINRFDFESAKKEVGFQILEEIEIDDNLVKEIVEFLIAKEKFEQRRDEFKRLMAVEWR